MKRFIHTFTDDDGLSFELKAEVEGDLCKAFVKGLAHGVVTVDGTFEDASEHAEERLNDFVLDSMTTHSAAIEKLTPQEVAA